MLDARPRPATRVGGAAAVVDVAAVGRVVDRRRRRRRRRANTRAATAMAAPLAVSTTMRRPSSERPSIAGDVRDVGGRLLDVEELGRLAGGRRGRRQTRASMRCSTSSGSLVPPRANSLMPLSWYGLCDAEITAPMRARRGRLERDRRAWARRRGGARRRPRGEPGDERRLEHRRRQRGCRRRRPPSTPRARGPRPARGRGRTTAVRSVLATPRTPSVPNFTLAGRPG